MTQQQAADQFVAQYNGKYIDEDRWYGSQCWDLVARYAREKWQCPSFHTGSGGAEGLYRLAVGPILDFFTRIPASQLKPGDIVVWSAEFYKPWGHTALVWKREGNTLFVFEQDGSKDPNGDGIADGVAYIAQRQITNLVAGGLRPKGGNEMVSKEAYLVGAQAVGTAYGQHFNYDPNRSVDQFAQFLLGQAPRITKEMETEVADGITGIKGVIGWKGYNSPNVGKLVVTQYPIMVKQWMDYASTLPRGDYVPLGEEAFVKKKK